MSSFRAKKKDAYGQALHPGDVCARTYKGKVELIVYKGDTWGGNKSKGEYGRFITNSGNSSIKYTSVIFVFDPMGKRRSDSSIVNEMIREFYEGIR